MNNSKKVLLGFTVLMFIMFGGMNIAPAQITEQIAERTLAATVYLEMKGRNGTSLGFGRGFFVRDNLIATNYHVIEGAASGIAKLVGKYTKYTIEGVTAIDKTNDLALLKVNAYSMKPLPLGDSNNVKTGAPVYIVGSQSGLEGLFSYGTINIESQNTRKWLQIIGTSVSPGGSGGPALNNIGEVIGISISTPSEHLGLGAKNGNFAIPINALKALLIESRVAKPLLQRRQPISAEAYYRWGYAKHELADYRAAISNYDIAIQLRPDYALAYYKRGVTKEMLKQYLAAASDYNMANRLVPEAATGCRSMGDMFFNFGAYESAIERYDIAIRLNPNYAEAYCNRGKANHNLEEYFPAIADFDMAIRLRLDYAEAYNYRGSAKSRLGQDAVAIADFDTAIRLKPDYIHAYNNRGLAKYNLRQYTSAITDYNKAIQLNPSDTLAYYRRGSAKTELGQHFEAISDIDMFIRLRPDNADGYNLRGAVKGSKLGQHAAAISDFDKAIQIRPDSARAYYARGLSKLALGRTWEAKQDFRTGLKLAEKAGNREIKINIEKILQEIQ